MKKPKISKLIFPILFFSLFDLSPNQFRPILIRTKIIFFALFLLIGVVMYVKNSDAMIIFQNNFDNSPIANSCGNPPLGWDSWGIDSGCSATFSGTTHCSGEIGEPGRGGNGKSLRLWRAGTLFENYDGGLYYGQGNNFNPTSNDFYVRWTMKIPSAATIDFTNAGSIYQKLFRINMNGGSGELYFNINTPYNDLEIPSGGAIQIGPFMHTDPILGWQTTNYTILSPADLGPLFDGQWHSYEFHMNSNTHLVEFWVDGILKHRNTNLASISLQSPQWIQHFGFGNRASGSVAQNSWQAWDFDDFIISDSYNGPTTSSDTTPPASPMGLSVQ